jgi:hypothetical protein
MHHVKFIGRGVLLLSSLVAFQTGCSDNVIGNNCPCNQLSSEQSSGESGGSLCPDRSDLSGSAASAACQCSDLSLSLSSETGGSAGTEVWSEETIWQSLIESITSMSSTGLGSSAHTFLDTGSIGASVEICGVGSLASACSQTTMESSYSSFLDSGSIGTSV